MNIYKKRALICYIISVTLFVIFLRIPEYTKDYFLSHPNFTLKTVYLFEVLNKEIRITIIVIAGISFILSFYFRKKWKEYMKKTYPNETATEKFIREQIHGIDS